MDLFIYALVVVVGMFFVYEMIDTYKSRKWGENPE